MTRIRPPECCETGFTQSARNGILHLCRLRHASGTATVTVRLDLAGCFEYIARAFWRPAEVVELVDTPDSGSGGGNPVEVRVLSSAPRRPWSPIPERVVSRRCRDSKAPLQMAGPSRLPGRARCSIVSTIEILGGPGGS